MNKVIECKELTQEELKTIEGGSWLSDAFSDAVGYLVGVNYAIYKEHAATAPWVAMGSK